MGKAQWGKQMSGIDFRQMTESDVDAVVEIENVSFSLPWSRQSFHDEMQNERAFYLLAVEGERAIGYVGAWLIFDEAHITNVAILPEYRRRGIGEKLMKQMIEAVKHKGIQSMTLEVRESNFAAQAMYKKFGFEVAGIRKNYYEDNRENAMIMWLKGIK